MISSPMRTQFDSVLRDQHLIDDISTFAGSDYFDEVPLYSRYRQVDFLKQYGDPDVLLIELALDYLDRVTSAIQAERIKQFVAITIVSDDNGEHLVPQIFVCNGNVDQRLADLRLSDPTSALGKQVEQLVKIARPDRVFSVLEDRVTLPGDVRVFVGDKSPPHGFLTLEDVTSLSRNEP